MLHLRPLLLALLTLTSSGFAEIREIRRLQEALPAIQPGALLVFDLDNTLIEPVGDYGSDQWYYYLVGKLRRTEGLSESAAEREAMRIWNHAQPSLRMRTVEPGTAQFLREQQSRGIRTLGLTAREPALIETTLTQLRTLGLKLDRGTLFPRKIAWHSVEAAHFMAGVLFIGEANDKGTLLIDLLRRLNQRPKGIVFIDDKARNVTSVDRAARRAGIPCVAFRYGATDAKVAKFNRGTQTITPSAGLARRPQKDRQG